MDTIDKRFLFLSLTDDCSQMITYKLPIAYLAGLALCLTPALAPSAFAQSVSPTTTSAPAKDNSRCNDGSAKDKDGKCPAGALNAKDEAVGGLSSGVIVGGIVVVGAAVAAIAGSNGGGGSSGTTGTR